MADASAYVEERLKFRPWAGQRRVMDAVGQALAGTGPTTIAVHSGNGVGKTSISAAAALYAYEQYRAAVVTTAPTGRQVRELLWKEIHGHCRRAKVSGRRVPGRFLTVKAERSPGSKNMILGFSTDNQQNIQGFHAPVLLVIVDEANGFPDDLYEAIDGNITGARSVLMMIGNPLVPVGRFYDACETKDGSVAVVHLDALDHPNVRYGEERIPGAVTKRWVDDKLARWGEHHMLYQARVRGLFPQHALDTFWTPAEVRAMIGREVQAGGPSVVSIDAARFGDDAAIILAMEGGRVTGHKQYPMSDTRTIVHGALEIAGSPDMYIVDDCIGTGVADKLTELGKTVHSFNGAKKPWGGTDDDLEFGNCRAEAYWLASRVSEQVCLDEDPCWEHQLPRVKYFFQPSTQKLFVEGKDKLRKDMGRSPDDADALAMNLWAQIRLLT